jgi:hypothetical protein
MSGLNMVEADVLEQKRPAVSDGVDLQALWGTSCRRAAWRWNDAGSVMCCGQDARLMQGRRVRRGSEELRASLGERQSLAALQVTRAAEEKPSRGATDVLDMMERGTRTSRWRRWASPWPDARQTCAQTFTLSGDDASGLRRCSTGWRITGASPAASTGKLNVFRGVKAGSRLRAAAHPRVE